MHLHVIRFVFVLLFVDVLLVFNHTALCVIYFSYKKCFLIVSYSSRFKKQKQKENRLTAVPESNSLVLSLESVSIISVFFCH